MVNPVVYWRNKEKKYQYLGKTGKIISFTKIFNPLSDFSQVPYFVGLIKLKKEKYVAELVVEGKKPSINARVKGILRKIKPLQKTGVIQYGVKFKLV